MSFIEVGKKNQLERRDTICFQGKVFRKPFFVADLQGRAMKGGEFEWGTHIYAHTHKMENPMPLTHLPHPQIPQM